MDFEVEQAYDADPDAVARAYTDPALYDLVGDASSLGRPEVIARREEGDVVTLEVRYHFTGELSPAARAALDPARLSWVEHSTHDLAARTVRFRMVADHYADRFRASGSAVVTPAGSGATRVTTAGVSIKAPFVARAVERAIVSGLRDHLHAESAVVDRFVRPGPG